MLKVFWRHLSLHKLIETLSSVRLSIHLIGFSWECKWHPHDITMHSIFIHCFNLSSNRFDFLFAFISCSFSIFPSHWCENLRMALSLCGFIYEKKREQKKKSCKVFPLDLVLVCVIIFIIFGWYGFFSYLYFSVECDIGITHLNPVSSMADLMVSHFLTSLWALKCRCERIETYVYLLFFQNSYPPPSSREMFVMCTVHMS